MFALFMLIFVFGIILYLFASVKLENYKQGVLKYEGDYIFIKNIKPEELKTTNLNINFTHEGLIHSYQVHISGQEGNSPYIESEALKYFLERHNILELPISVKTADITLFDYIFSV
ncbi:MAG1140 family protein [Mycoplasma seminis]|uniref:Uncharacterized protein n=1 Tax=Mycoplasma seminis TaxID=512749 RepID=A0ABY9HAV4_9MOLU|nr:hypothetical protein [Mycoplasma seminis]WLP85733.1 hypothetical protein Q8852_01080 [Mycoplasma seminis]